MLRLDPQELGVFTQPILMAGVGLVPLRYLGRGSFATAYAATAPDDERTVVIKLFRSDAVGAAALNREEKTLQELRKRNIKGITNLVGSVVYPPPPAAPAGLAGAVPQLYPTVLVLEPEGVTVERVVRDWQRDTHYRMTRALSRRLLCSTCMAEVPPFRRCHMQAGGRYPRRARVGACRALRSVARQHVLSS
jgi:hypothetical protein